VAYLGTEYHVQTEDWGEANPYLVSRVYTNGAVIKSIKTAYKEVLPSQQSRQPSNIRLAMRIQHQKILDLLLSGRLVNQ
jgi:hypothetical protein